MRHWMRLKAFRASRMAWFAMLALVLLGSGRVSAESAGTGASEENIGTVQMDISCNAAAKTPFLRGLALMHSFAWADARQGFQAASAADSSCAMAFWGEALSYYDGLHNPPTDNEVEAARQAVAKAEEVTTATARERAYVAAAKALFENYTPTTRTDHDFAYSAAMRSVHERYPNDVDAAALYALSLLSIARRGVDNGADLQTQAAGILDPLFATHQDHPGLAHYVIHTYDDMGDREPGIAAARAYAKIAPSVTHALHMPSHIFAGLGMWEETLASNKASFEASERQVRERNQPLHRRSYHAISYWLYALLQKGQESEARALLAEHRPVLEAGDDGAKASLHNLLARFYMDTDHPAEAAMMPVLLERPFVKAEALFVRGLGQARTGQLQMAETSLADMRVIASRVAAQRDLDLGVRLRILDVQSKQLEATLMLARQRGDDAIRLLREAVELEDAPGVSWAPPDSGAGLPAHEFLGEALLQLERRTEAAHEFEIALEKTPGRKRSIDGLARAGTASSGSAR